MIDNDRCDVHTLAVDSLPPPQHRELPVQLQAHPVRRRVRGQQAPQHGEAALNEGTRKACLGILGWWKFSDKAKDSESIRNLGEITKSWNVIQSNSGWRDLKPMWPRTGTNKLLGSLWGATWRSWFIATCFFPPSNVAKQIFKKQEHTNASMDALHLQELGNKILVAELDSRLTWESHGPWNDVQPFGPFPTSTNTNTYKTFRNQMVPRIVSHHLNMITATSGNYA